MIDDILPTIASFLRFDNVRISNFLFRLHTQITVTVLVFMSILIGLNQYFGTPIDCVQETVTDIDYSWRENRLLNNYCWTHTTYTIPSLVGVNYVAYPGVGYADEEEEVIFHKYYQWVPLFLLLQVRYIN